MKKNRNIEKEQKKKNKEKRKKVLTVHKTNRNNKQKKITTIKYFIKHTLNYKVLFVIMIIGTILDFVFGNIRFIYLKQIVDGISGNEATARALFGILVWIGIFQLLSMVFGRAAIFSTGRLEYSVMKQMLEQNFKYILGHSYEFFSNNFAGALAKKMNKLVDAYEILMDQLVFNFLPVLVQSIISIIILTQVNIYIGIILTVWVVIYIYVSYRISTYRLKFDKKANKIESAASGLMVDAIINNFNITLFGSLNRELKLVSVKLDKWLNTTFKSFNIGEVGDIVQGSLMLVLEIILFTILILEWEKGNVTAGDFVLMQGLITVLFEQIWSIGNSIKRTVRVYSDSQEMIKILNTPHGIVNAPEAQNFQVTKGNIDIKSLNFTYKKGKKVFDNLNLSISSKEKVALVSKSGGGKSTLIKLLLRLHDPIDNVIYIDGVDVKQIKLDALRSNISLIPQEPVLFHRSLKDNISYGKPNATLEEIIEASKKAQCHEFISNLEKGYDTFVGERGVKLSGGERQRVAIARAILEDCPILILDEATSALDSESEQKIQKALEILMKGKTTIAVAHRLSTIMQMDRIIVLEKGKVSESGTHAELINNPESHYKKLWDIQKGGFVE